MIRTENILSLRVEPRPIDHGKWNADEKKQKARPPAVQESNEPEPARKQDGYQQRKKEQNKEQEKNDHAITGMNDPQNSHAGRGPEDR